MVELSLHICYGYGGIYFIHNREMKKDDKRFIQATAHVRKCV